MARTRDTESIQRARASIRSVDDLPDYCNVLLFGPNGQGKTTFAATAPDVLILSVREPEGVASAAGKGTGAEYIECRSFQDVSDAYWMLVDMLDKGTCKYKSVALDTVSGLHALAMEMVRGEAEDKDPTRQKSDTDQRDWGRGNTLCNGLVHAFVELPLNTILLSQQRINKDDDGDIEEITLALPPGSQGPILGMASIKGYITRKKVKTANGRKIATLTELEPTDEMPFLTDRTGKLTNPAVNLTMPKVLAAWDEIRAGAPTKSASTTARRRRPRA
jgi:AAA domain